MIGLEKQFNNREWDSVSVCLVIVCVLTNLSQLPFFAARSSTRMISVAAWFALALFMLLKKDFQIVDIRILGLLKYAYFFAVAMFVQALFTGIATNAAVYCIPIFCLFSSILSASLQQAGSMKKSGMLLQTHMSSALSLYPSSYIFSILPEICLRCPVRSIFTPPKTRFLKLQSPQLYCC